MNMEALASAMQLVELVIGPEQTIASVEVDGEPTYPAIDDVTNSMRDTQILTEYTASLYTYLTNTQLPPELSDEQMLVLQRTRAMLMRYVLLVMDYYAGLV